MRKRNLGKRIAVFLLALVMASSTALAAKGAITNVSTGLDGGIDTEDTISLPIRIMDYESDGMLFEFAENYANKTAADFGSEFFQIVDTVGDIANTTNDGAFDDTTVSLNSNDYVSYTRLTYAGKTSNNWLKNNAGIWISTYCQKDSAGNWIGVIGEDLEDINDIRYVTLVYRSNVESDTMAFAFGDSVDEANTSGRYTSEYEFTNSGHDGGGSESNWTYAVYDLKNGTLANSWGSSHPLISDNPNRIYIGLPLDADGEWMDLAHVAFFDNADCAKAFGEYALTDGSDRGDNRAYGLLRGSRNQSNKIDFTGIDDEIGNSVQMLNTYTETESTVDYSTKNGLGYKLLGTFGWEGIANIGLLESSLSSEGYPVYKEEVVDYVAKLLKKTLEVSERTSDGWKNYRYIKGTVSDIYGGTDLATALRSKINGNMGSYAASAGKDLVGTWSEVSGNIGSYYDAAYFILNSIFVDGSYNSVSEYDYLVLSAGTDSKTKDKTYVFDSGFVNTTSPNAGTTPSINYNNANGTIQNTSATGKAYFAYSDSGNATLNPFLPIVDKNNATGMTKSPYYQDDGIINGVKGQTNQDTTYNRNFSFAIASEGEFVYHADDELFFEFEGDDDVYLFINNELVMDNGSAHSINKVRFDLNDYVNAAKAGTLGNDTRNSRLSLEEGGTYTFKFYYMERHSYGSNIRISTNIKVTDPTMTTTKTAWQEDVKVDFGGIVDKSKVVEYGFGIQNTGEEKLFNLTFTDNNIGVKLDSTSGLQLLTGSRATDKNGQSLEASDLTAVVSHPDYDDINITFADNNALKTFLANLTADGTETNGGLYTGATVQIRGIGYTLTEDQVKEAVFDNTVLTTATNQTSSKTLQGQATMRVFVPADPMYYEWADHELNISKEKLISDIMSAANSPGNALAGKVPNLTVSNVNKIELVTKAGNAISSPYVTIDGNNNLTVEYDSSGSKVFYVQITYKNTSNKSVKVDPIPVLVNVTDVEDSVYVLDYGLDAELTDANELFKNDAIVVPGRETKNGILALGSNGAYASNEITFTSSDTAGVINGANGTYTLSEQDGKQKLTFNIGDGFMEEVDTFQFAMNVYEKGITPSNISGALNINKEVEMYKNVKVLPATVVYYEDNFPAINYYYEEDDGNPATLENTFVRVGSGLNENQSVDQAQEYGQDALYQNNSDMSGNSLTTIALHKPGTVASFQFTGTGFELVGRTNATDSGKLIVTVKNGDSVVKRIPVITEFDNNNDGGLEEIYQVPIIKVEGLDKANYTVEISGVPQGVYDNEGNRTGIETTYLYVDGLRIYQPLGATNDNYLATENGAEFVEIRNEIAKGYAAACEYDGESLLVSAGLRTWTENYDGSKVNTSEEDSYYKYVANEVKSVDEYLVEGPNNEVYMMGDYVSTALVFEVSEVAEAKTKNLQIGVHAVDEGLFVGATSTGMNAKLYYGVGESTWKELQEVKSGTEQYYTIDYTKCPYDEATERYQVAILVESGMVSFTNLKMNGLELNKIDGVDVASVSFKEGILVDAKDTQGNDVDLASVEVPRFMSLRTMMMRAVGDGTTTPEGGNDTTEPGDGDDTTEPGDGDDTTKPEDGENGNAGGSGDAGNSGTGDDAGNTGDSSTESNSGSTGNTGSTSDKTNSSNEENKSMVDTGDNANILLMVVLMVVSLGVGGTVLVLRRRNK